VVPLQRAEPPNLPVLASQNLPVPVAPANLPVPVAPANLPVPVKPPVKVVRAAPPRRGKAVSNRLAIIIAVIGLLLAAGTVVLYVTRPTGKSPAAGAGSSAPQATPDSAVREFLSGVFLSSNADRLAAIVCASWPPAEALSRTKGMVDPTAKVSWDQVRTVTTQAKRVTMTARLGLRLPDDVQPSRYQQWHFTLVDEDGWKVCDASPAVS